MLVATTMNILRDVGFEFVFCRALLSPELENGNGMVQSHSQARPAEILVPPWSMGKAAMYDIVQAQIWALQQLHRRRKLGYVWSKCRELGWESWMEETYCVWRARKGL